MNSSFLQEVDREAASRAGAGHAHADLARHHWDWCRLDGPDTCHWLVIWPRQVAPGNIRPELMRQSQTYFSSGVYCAGAPLEKEDKHRFSYLILSVRCHVRNKH